MSTFPERLKELRNETGISISELADKINIAKSTLSRYEASKMEPTLAVIVKIANFFNVSLDWLAGNSSIREPFITSNNIVKIYNELNDNQKRELYRYTNYLKNSNVEYREKSRVKIVGQTACGAPIEYGDSYAQDIDDVHDIPREADYALNVNGDSMEPLIKNGQLIYVRQCPDVENGTIAVVEIDGAVTCKKVYKRDDHIELHSINTVYEPIIITSGNFRILGKVLL